jgi:DNA-binding IclR family transcriptional regulator
MEIDFRRVKTVDGVRSVSRALGLLSALGKEGRSLTELARAVGISPSTASRLLNTLQSERFVSHTDDNKYVPGLALTSLLYSTDQWAPLRKVATNATQTLRDEMDETSAFFVRSMHERLCIESVESSRLVRRVCLPGERGRIYLGAAGKTLLAFGSNENPWKELFGSKETFTTATEGVRKVSDLKEECEQIRLQGYAFSRQESTLESWAVSAPIYLHGTLAGALTMVIPSTRYSGEYLTQAIKATISTARSYSDKPQTERKRSNDRQKTALRKRQKRNPQRA